MQRIKAEEHLKANEENILKGIRVLKKIGLYQYIIERGDCVLIKKKKIRKIREMVKSEQENLDVKILDELFTYLEVYEKNCQTLINSDSRNKTDGNE